MDCHAESETHPTVKLFRQFAGERVVAGVGTVSLAGRDGAGPDQTVNYIQVFE